MDPDTVGWLVERRCRRHDAPPLGRTVARRAVRGKIASWLLVLPVAAAGCGGTVSLDTILEPPPRIDARRIGPGIMPVSPLPGILGRAHDSLTQVILASWWGVSKRSHDAGIECHERILTEPQARLLADNQLLVSLPDLRDLRPEVARVFTTCTGCLRFGALESIEPEAAAALAGHRDLLSLSSLCDLDAAAARGLAACTGPLTLDGISRLQPGVAEALAGHRGCLSLNGLVKLSAHDAGWLARHDGDLSLNGLRSMSTDVARQLAALPHGLFINSVEALSKDAAAALATHPGWWLGCDGIVAIDTETLASLSRHPRSGWAIVTSVNATARLERTSPHE